MNRLRQQHDMKSVNKSNRFSKDDLLILHFASDFKTGHMNEIKALVDHGMVKINENGFTSLTSGWERKIHPFILNAMRIDGWNVQSDRENKFSLHNNIREAIDLEWKHSAEGWVSKTTGKTCHFHYRYDNFRKDFERSFEEIENEIDGIAQFGI